MLTELDKIVISQERHRSMINDSIKFDLYSELISIEEEYKLHEKLLRGKKPFRLNKMNK